MLVHKGGQINNVQLITGVRVAEMSQLQNCSVMCTKNGSYCENEKKERRSQGEGLGRMCTKNGNYCEKEKQVGGSGRVGGGRVGGSGGCEQRSEAFVKIQKKMFFFFFWGGGRVGGGVRLGSGWM